MGFMTEIGILNDRWDEIRAKPKEFVEQIYMACLSHGREPSYIIGQTTVAKTHHADDHRVYLAYGNSFCELNPERGWDERRLEIHKRHLELVKQYLKDCEKETKRLLESAI